MLDPYYSYWLTNLVSFGDGALSLFQVDDTTS